MATYKYKKVNTKKQTPEQQKKTPAKKNTKGQSVNKNTNKPKTPGNPDSILNQILPYVWGLLGFAVAF